MTPPFNRERFAKLLGMLGSENDGEVVAAGRTADKLVRSSGLSWRGVLVDAQPLSRQLAGVSGQIDFVLRYRGRLSEWELKFLASLRAQQFPVTARQRNVLSSIVEKLRARAEAA